MSFKKEKALKVRYGGEFISQIKGFASKNCETARYSALWQREFALTEALTN